jgi:uncharacterized iron-regulated membrane protein
MNVFKTLWDLHKWTGLAICLVVAVTSVTGFLLLMKKEFSSIQPPTQVGAEGTLEEFISIAAVLDAARATGDPAFSTIDDIDRIDFRPGKRVHKVRSKHGHRELQVDAVTGVVLSHTWRPSDLIEEIHDGRWFAEIWHSYGMPIVALALLFLSFSGVYIWITPVLRKRRRRRARTESA